MLRGRSALTISLLLGPPLQLRVKKKAIRRTVTLKKKAIGVGISVAKSLTSPTGACDFAKIFRLNAMRDDVYPVSLKKLQDSFSPVGWSQLMLTPGAADLRISTCLRLVGLGLKAASRTMCSKMVSRHGPT